MNALPLLASDGPASDTITPGVLGFLAIAGIGFALYFLMKSMRKRLAGIQVEPDEGPGGDNGTGLHTSSDEDAEPGRGSAPGASGPSAPSG